MSLIRNLARATLAATAGMLVASGALAQATASSEAQPASKPPTMDKPARIIAWAGPGSAFDTLARMLADGLSKKWNVSVTVENKVGAGGIVGTQYAARVPADGSTILITTNSAHILNFLLKDKLAFDPNRDFVPVSKLAEGQTTFAVSSNSPYNTLAEFLEAGKQGSGLTYSSFANGSASHLMGEQLQRLAGSNLIHVPYAGGEMAALTDLVGGRLDASFMSEGTALAQSQAGTVKVLGITGLQRTKTLPDVPTFEEQGYTGLDLSGWIGMFLPAGSPPEAVEAWSVALQELVASPEMNERMRAMGFEPVGNSSEAFAQDFKHDFDRWTEIVEVTGFKPQ